MPQILIVDDGVVEQRFTAEILREAGHDVALAENGLVALEKIRHEAPDLVVTDLQMPEMDGLGLVKALHAELPALPVILITAHGSEQLAVDALRSGASSYVPKADLAKLLAGTVDDVLHVAKAERKYTRLIECARLAEFDFELDNEPVLVEPLVDLLQQMIANISGLEHTERLRTAVAIEEALRNAVLRGNLELTGPVDEDRIAKRLAEAPYRDRRTRIHASIRPDVVEVKIVDQGPGFPVDDLVSKIRSAELTEDAGRGLVLMHAFLDEVRFNTTGNEVTLRKVTAESLPAAQKSGAAPDGEQVKAKPERKKSFGELIPEQEGETIGLPKRRLVIGRDRSCDIVLHHHDVSSHHCQLFLYQGWWYAKDLQTKNGIKINGVRVSRHRISPGDVLSIAKHRFRVEYDPGKLGAVGPTPPPDPY